MERSSTDDLDAASAASGAAFSLVTGDRLYRAQRSLGLIPARGLGTGRRIAIAVALTWLPLMLWALWNHLLLPGVAEEPLLRHFGIHARFLVALPLFLASEGLVERALRRVLPQFVSSGVVDESLLPAFRRILAGAARLRDSRLALLVIIALVAANAVAGWEQAEHNHELVWTQPLVGRGFAAAWFSCVSRPIFLLVLLAWLWRLVVVTRLFQQIAGLDLRLAPTHPDRAGGIAVDDAGLLGAPEIGPVADTVALYETVRRMRVLPVSRSSIVPLALAAALPLVPVFATQMPLKDAVLKLLGPLAGL